MDRKFSTKETQPLEPAFEAQSMENKWPASGASDRVVLFDGRCSLCQGSRRWAARLDWFRKVNWVNFRNPCVRAAVPQLTDEQLETEMWVVTAEGKMLSGFAAWRNLLKAFSADFFACASILLAADSIHRKTCVCLHCLTESPGV